MKKIIKEAILWVFSIAVPFVILMTSVTEFPLIVILIFSLGVGVMLGILIKSELFQGLILIILGVIVYLFAILMDFLKRISKPKKEKIKEIRREISLVCFLENETILDNILKKFKGKEISEKVFGVKKEGNKIKAYFVNNSKEKKEFEFCEEWVSSRVKKTSIRYFPGLGKALYEYETFLKYDEDGNQIHFKTSFGFERIWEYEGNEITIYAKDSSGNEGFCKYTNDGKHLHFKYLDGEERWWKYHENGEVAHFGNSFGKEEWRDESGCCISKEEFCEKWRLKEEFLYVPRKKVANLKT